MASTDSPSNGAHASRSTAAVAVAANLLDKTLVALVGSHNQHQSAANIKTKKAICDAVVEIR